MKKHVSGLWILVAVAALTGCSQNRSPLDPAGMVSSTDQTEIISTLASTPQLVDDGTLESSDIGTVTSVRQLAPDAAAAIQPLRYWRSIESVTRRFEFAFADTDSTGQPTTAIVTVHKTLRGTFNIVAGSPPDDTTSTTADRRLVRKPLLDYWTRRVMLKRMDRTGESGRVRHLWRVVAISGVKVTSARPPDDQHVKIESVRIQAGVLDTTLVHPLEFFRLRRILDFKSGTQVTFTATTDAPDDIVVLVRTGMRIRLHSNGGNTYTGTWIVPDEPGVRHFGINALSHDTLFDDAAPYNSIAWVFPYVNLGQELADEMPQ